MNYEGMSDKDVNEAILKNLGYRICSKKDVSNEAWSHKTKVCYGTFPRGRDKSFIGWLDTKDYCNNPADMWPIIVNNKIETCWYGGDEWRAIIDNQFQAGPYKRFICLDTNPLRAAAIVYLKMMKAKNAD